MAELIDISDRFRHRAGLCPARWAVIRGHVARIAGDSWGPTPYDDRPAELARDALIAWFQWGYATQGGKRLGRIPGRARAGLPWSDHEKEILRQASQGRQALPAAWIADLLQRPNTAVRAQRRQLGLTRAGKRGAA